MAPKSKGKAGPASTKGAGKAVVKDEESVKAAKNRRKAERAALEQERKEEVEKMMAMTLDVEEEEVKEEKGFVARDRFGNTVSKADVEKKATAEKREAARAKREEKVQPLGEVVVVDDSEKVDILKLKAERGEKLSNKERKMLKKSEERDRRQAVEEVDELAQFSLSVSGKSQEVSEEYRQKQFVFFWSDFERAGETAFSGYGYKVCLRPKIRSLSAKWLGKDGVLEAFGLKKVKT